jgi:hypothetical protein
MVQNMVLGGRVYYRCQQVHAREKGGAVDEKQADDLTTHPKTRTWLDLAQVTFKGYTLCPMFNCLQTMDISQKAFIPKCSPTKWDSPSREHHPDQQRKMMFVE